MESFFLAASVVVPFVVYMAVGGLIRKLGILAKDQFKALNTMIFRIFIPLTLFFNVYDADLGETVKPVFFIYVSVSVVILFTITFLLCRKFVKEMPDVTALTQGIYRSNFVLFGNTIGESLCGPAGVAFVSALASLIVPLFNVLAVLLFETNRGGKVKVSGVLLNIAKNPLVEAGVLGIVFAFFHIPVPILLAKPLMNLGNIATPLALVSLGGMLSFGSMLNHAKMLVAANTGRLVVYPLIMLGISILFGYRGDALVAILAVFASPTAVASAPMAQSMGGNGELAGEIVATTSVCCVLTIFLMVFTLSSMGLI